MFRLTRAPVRRAASVRVRDRARLIAAIVAIAAVSALHAQTIVPNAYLHTELPPWAAFQSAAPDPVGSGEAPVWQSPPDVDGNPASGSVRIHLAPSVQDAASGIAQCVDFAVPTSVSFLNYGMAFRAPTAATLDGSMSAVVEVRLYADPGCTGFLSGGTQGQALVAGSPPAETWYRIADNGFVPNDAPVMAASAQVRGYLRQTGTQPAQTDYAIHLDHFVLVLNSTTPVELIRFQVD
ncbi:MAG TPA: hypothetical protein VMR06_00410 [Dokdonella sp.]|uniref:hypothetical protein n=1 Tax=Dokdonella sp. TaxID=2291710 RepID=UPI002C04018F|nr:hypothetical protein [Dokdonella sp.]HUD40442.1 hypothetical protein [Dokdonella sp.]